MQMNNQEAEENVSTSLWNPTTTQHRTAHDDYTLVDANSSTDASKIPELVTWRRNVRFYVTNFYYMTTDASGFAY